MRTLSTAHNNRKIDAQASIEMTLAFVAIIILLLGTLKIFSWLNQCLVSRQKEYQATRAGNYSLDLVRPLNILNFNEEE